MTSADEQVSELFFNQLRQKLVRVSGGIPRIVSFSMPVGRVEESTPLSFKVISGNCLIQLRLSDAIFERGALGVWTVRFPEVEGGLSVEELPG